MAEIKKYPTPKLDELEKGPWPSFVTEIKRAGEKKQSANELLAQLEDSYNNNIGYWKHGGIVGVMGYGGGVIGRYSSLPEKYPELEQFHTIRVNQPSGFFYKASKLRELCDIWDKYGSGLTNLHGSTGDLVLLGCNTDALQPCFDEMSEKGWDLGGSGGCLRTPSCCCGPARCEYACFDTLDVTTELTKEFQDELHRPMWPYKMKIKVSGCPNDCVAAIARSDFSIIGTWRDALVIDNAAVKAEYLNKGYNVQGMVVDKCPTKALKLDDSGLSLCAEECVRCMHCINNMPKALSIGKERGASILCGGKATVVKSAFMSWVIVPFMKMEAPYDEVKDLFRRVTEWWDEHGKNRERLGELIFREGMGNFLRAIGVEAAPQMVMRPRANPYVFWQPEEVQG